jgi:hypothetical protein
MILELQLMKTKVLQSAERETARAGYKTTNFETDQIIFQSFVSLISCTSNIRELYFFRTSKNLGDRA